jgi:hypothetical protein
VILRKEPGRVLAIGQASHAWLSGQLARAWGNERFGRLDPYEEVCLAAEQHDVGMAEWDLEPSFDQATGLPHSFTDMPIEVHMELWRQAPGKLISQSRYAALLVSMHGMRLYEMRDLTRLPDEQAKAVHAFLGEHRELQRRLGDSLDADEQQVRRASDLIWTWDFLSLALCLDWAPCTAGNVPTAGNPTTIDLEPTGKRTILLQPWPFDSDRLCVRAEGRQLSKTGYATAAELRSALEMARWETIAFELRRA